VSLADDYFARVRPLLGAGLSGHTVAVDYAEAALLVLELLAGCMLEDVIVTRPETCAALVERMAWKQPFQPLRIISGAGAAGAASRAEVRISARRVRGAASVRWDPARREVSLAVDPDDALAWMDASYHVARTIRDALLHGAPWPEGERWHGDPAWPFSPRSAPIASAPAPAPDPAALRGRHVAVVGCGSVGSEAIRALAGAGARWTLVDDARVTVFNLARQWYGAGEVGLLKVEALAARLAPAPVFAWPARLEVSGLGALAARLAADPPDVVLLATGTHHHGMLGELLWRLGIPHVAACCYPQARYFEVSVVSPREGTPCLHCFRGHLYRGAPEPPPMTDEVARFLYRPMPDAQRERAYTDLVAEPATRIETLRAAEVLARCALELCAPRRAPWFQRVLSSGTTCLLGGNVAHPLPGGGHAYGIREAGQVIRLGLEDVAGAEDSIECGACGRRMEVALRDPPPPVLGDDADLALLAPVRAP
jgi:hypothetical protein